MRFHRLTPSRSGLKLLLAAGLLLAAAFLAAAATQETAPSDPELAPSDPEFAPDAYRVQVELALVQATVRDADGNYVKGLKQKDFRLLEDGKLRELVLFSEEPDAPIRIAFLLDVSGSMAFQENLTMARGGIRYFLDRLGSQDEVALLSFADGEVDVVVDFTTDKRAISDALLSLKAYGQTALLDAVARAPGMVPRRGNARRAIVLLSDGVDNISRLAPGEAVQIARRTEVPVYSIGFLDSVERRRAELGGEALQRFSSETGGQVFLAENPYEVSVASRAVVDELKHTYVLGYYPSPSRGAHTLQVEASCKDCKVTSRRGLYATPTDS